MHPHIVVGWRLVCVYASTLIKDVEFEVSIVAERERTNESFDLQLDPAILLNICRVIQVAELAGWSDNHLVCLCNKQNCWVHIRPFRIEILEYLRH